MFKILKMLSWYIVTGNPGISKSVFQWKYLLFNARQYLLPIQKRGVFFWSIMQKDSLTIGRSYYFYLVTPVDLCKFEVEYTSLSTFWEKFTKPEPEPEIVKIV